MFGHVENKCCWGQDNISLIYQPAVFLFSFAGRGVETTEHLFHCRKNLIKTHPESFWLPRASPASQEFDGSSEMRAVRPTDTQSQMKPNFRQFLNSVGDGLVSHTIGTIGTGPGDSGSHSPLGNMPIFNTHHTLVSYQILSFQNSLPALT